LKSYWVLLVLVFLGAACWGQEPQSADDPIAQNLFPPELVMKYHQEINLDEGQSKAIREAIQRLRQSFWTCSGTRSRKRKSLSSY
jgi:hypothetical protein